MALLDAGKADLFTQRLAAEIIRTAATKPLPKPHVNRKRRDDDIAYTVMLLVRTGTRPGDAHELVAKSYRVSVETVRKAARRPSCVKEAEMRFLMDDLEKKGFRVYL